MQQFALRAARPRVLVLSLFVAASVAAATPGSVGVPGSYQDKAGCPGAWQPDCPATMLSYSTPFDLWTGTFNVSAAGSYEYKIAIDGRWDENYGTDGQRNGANIPLIVAAPGQVSFVYDHKTHWAADSTGSRQIIAAVPGSFQHLIGCGGDWQADCFLSLLEGPGALYKFTTRALPKGSYECKVALNGSWNENYGAGGVREGSNIGFTVPSDLAEVDFVYNPATHILNVFIGGAPPGDLGLAQAHWVSRDTMAWNVGTPPADAAFALHGHPSGGLDLSVSGVTGATTTIPLKLDPAGLSAEQRARFPHLAGFAALKIAAGDLAPARLLLKGQLAVSEVSAGKLVDASSLQIPGVLDDLYAYSGKLGVTFSRGRPTLRVWAPTALSVNLRLYDSSSASGGMSVSMTPDGATGTWAVTGSPSWRGKFYQYEVDVYVRSSKAVEHNLVTDPYSLSLSTNSARTQIVDLADPALMPHDWDELEKPELRALSDSVLYELHVRDFSAGDQSVPAGHRGTFLAFTDAGSRGMRHLTSLAHAGLTHVHLLPAFDFATVDEDKGRWLSPSGNLASLPADSAGQQEAVMAVADRDGFNWGYDPWHYTVPEGSYATNPDGAQRIVEFRRMVQALNGAGLRVVMDVVYNHTTAAGQDARSVLDRIVPGYYHRLNQDGNVETSTCCQNTATEHLMMGKLMLDSVLIWATAYKVDGFRFDLMGHHMKSNLLAIQAALRGLTEKRDGVDGSKVLLYGEGWNFGEVADNVRGVNATQLNMAGTGIGTFSDRLRDATRGGGPFSPRRDQGFATGLFLAPNGIKQDQPQTLERLLHLTDLVRLGLAGNLRDWTFVDGTGASVKGSQVDYNGQPGGYALTPLDTITYISAHDNETWFDALQAKLPPSTPMSIRVRVHNLGNSIVALAQGIPFFHAGDELLRSKSGDKNSYNSGDWFNRLDFTAQTNNWGVGLPPARDNQPDWPVLQPLLHDGSLQPTPDDIRRAREHFEELLRIRGSSRLFRLGSAAAILSRVKAYNTGQAQTPGLIVMSIEGSGREDEERLVVLLFNATGQSQTFQHDAFRQQHLSLHKVQKSSSDSIVRRSRFDRRKGTFSVPAWTAAVFVGQGEGRDDD
jgi:pullulanase